jgi:putative heme iron utilization protein
MPPMINVNVNFPTNRNDLFVIVFTIFLSISQLAETYRMNSIQFSTKLTSPGKIIEYQNTAGKPKVNTFGRFKFGLYSSSSSLLPSSIAQNPVGVSGAGSRREEMSLAPDMSEEGCIRPSITDRARTVTYICTSGTLCTTSTMKDVTGYPFGSYVDYILDEKGWPVMLLSDHSLHTQNIQKNPAVSLFIQLPRHSPHHHHFNPALTQNPGENGSGREVDPAHARDLSLVQAQAQEDADTMIGSLIGDGVCPGISAASLSRVTMMGKLEPLPKSEETALKFAFSIIHPYSEEILDSPRFSLYRLNPEKIYFSGGFGVLATWIEVEDYEAARADVIAQDVPSLLSRVNLEKRSEMFLMCKHFLNLSLDDVEKVHIQAIDRLGVDLRVKSGMSNGLAYFFLSRCG